MTRTKPAGRVDRTLETVEHLIAMSYVIQQIVSESASPDDLSNVQVRLVAILRDRTPGMSELGRLLGLEKSSVTGLVDRAAERGLVRRERPDDDRRAVHVVLTARGRATDTRLRKTIVGRVARLLDALSVSERERLFAATETIVSDYLSTIAR